MDPQIHGLVNLGNVHARLAPARAIELALARKEGMLAANGAFAAKTGVFTGRSPKDKYIVKRPTTEATIAFGSVNQPMDPGNFERLWERARTYFQRREVFVCDGIACADPA